MKRFALPLSLRKVGQGLLASALLATCAATAAPAPGNQDTPSTNPNVKGAGAAKLSGNSEFPQGSQSSSASMAGENENAGQALTAEAFLKEAVEGNSAEVTLAQLAERKSQSPEVKQLAQMIQKDHEQANQTLRPIAQAHGISMNQPLDEKHQTKLKKFEQLSGTQFDQAYTKDMLQDHVKDIAKYQKAARQIQESDVKQYAQTTLPALHQHLQHAQTAARSVGVDQTTISSILNKKPQSSMGGSSEEQQEQSGSGSSQPNQSHPDLQNQNP